MFSSLLYIFSLFFFNTNIVCTPHSSLPYILLTSLHFHFVILKSIDILELPFFCHTSQQWSLLLFLFLPTPLDYVFYILNLLSVCHKIICILNFSLSLKWSEASSRLASASQRSLMPSSHHVIATIPGYCGCTNRPPKWPGMVAVTWWDLSQWDRQSWTRLWSAIPAVWFAFLDLYVFKKHFLILCLSILEDLICIVFWLAYKHILSHTMRTQTILFLVLIPIKIFLSNVLVSTIHFLRVY